MNKKTLLIGALLFSSLSFAQISFPKESSHAEVEQNIGLTEVEVEYHRPNAKGRKVFGELVPFGKVWRTGANENTTISFSTDVEIEGKKLAKGKYALYTKPEKNSTEVYFYKSTDNWGNPEKWDNSLIALSVDVKNIVNKDFKESFTIDFSDVNTDQAKLNISWEKTTISLKITSPTNELVLNDIKTKLNADSSARDYYSAANYYYTKKLDFNQAKKWIAIAIEKSNTKVPPYFVELQQKLNEKK